MKNPRDKILVALFLLIALFLCYTVVILSSDVSLSAKSSVLYEPTEKRFIYSKNADTRLPMASTTKIMTALVAIDRCPLDRIVSIADKAIGIEGSSLYLKAGEALSMKDLLYGLLLRSANDAACAIAYEIAGGIDEFADMMNEKAQELGLTDTHFTNPHGLHDTEHYTTARELAIISAAALSRPELKEIVSTKRVTIKNSEGEARLVVNHNKLLSMYEGAIGVKTGFTKKAGRCLVGACERDGLSFITVTINAPDDWNDHIKLFDLGYSLFEMRTLAEKNEFLYKIPVIGGKEDSIIITNKDEIKRIFKRSDPTVTKQIDLCRYTSAPIKEGDIIGYVKFYLDGEEIERIPLTAGSDVYKKAKRIFN